MLTMNNNMKIMLFIFTLINAFGCSASKNLVGDEKFKSFSKNCYQTTKNSFLYSIRSCKGGIINCSSIQAYGVAKSVIDKNRYVPNSQVELESNIDYWNKRIDRAALAGKTKYTSSLKAGSLFDVVGLYRERDGTIGTFWYVQVKLKSSGEIIELPAKYHLLQPSWLNKDNTLSFDSRFVKVCPN